MKNRLVLLICLGIGGMARADLPLETNGFLLGGKVLKAGGMEITWEGVGGVPGGS